MTLTLVLVSLVVVIALIFDFTNGFHDAANAIATCVSTRSMRPKAALLMAAIMNVIGALLGTGVAKTIGSGIIDISHIANQGVPIAERNHFLLIILGALIGAIAWNVITWYFGLPSSSSHALIGGMAGVGVVSATTVHWGGILDHVIIPMVVSPLVGFCIAYGVMKMVLCALANASYHRTMQNFRFCQRFSAAAMALGHGLQDAQKTMGIITIALVAGDYHSYTGGEMEIPFWVKVAAALAISVGTYFGGGRIMKTLGSKVIDVTPAHGLVAEATSASILYFTAFVWHAPISTTQSVSSAIMGVGATKRFSAVRWGVAGNIAIAWVLTLPGSALIGALVYLLMHAVVPV